MAREGHSRPCRICGKPVCAWGDYRDVHRECLEPELKERNNKPLSLDQQHDKARLYELAKFIHAESPGISVTEAYRAAAMRLGRA